MTKRAWKIGGVVVVELAGLAFIYQVFTDFTCSATDSESACRFIRSLVARAIVILPAIALFIGLRRLSNSRRLEAPTSQTAPSWPRGGGSTLDAVADVDPFGLSPGHIWLAVHLLGLALLLQPLFWVSPSDPQVFFDKSLGPWILGSVLALTGAIAWAAPLAEWRTWATRECPSLPLIVVVAFFVPDFARLVEPLWHWQLLATSTFATVAKLLRIAGTEIYVDPADYIIGLDDFYVRVAQQCSGVEGFALIASFVVIYGILFRNDLHLARYCLFVLPLALAASWILNALRIFALIVIGAWISPEIAVNGFHSYAGWMLFTVLAVAIICVVHITPALRKKPTVRGMGLREDWLAARILPLSLLLATGVVGAAFTLDVELAAPYRALVLAIVLAFFWRHYRMLSWSRDLVSVVAGALVGLAWIGTAPTVPNSAVIQEALGDYGPIALVTWVLLRVLLTTILVPLAEELFFRGYLLGRLNFGGPLGASFAILLSSALFALLHSRWMEAWAAGVVFALVMLRRNRLGDALIAHVTANGLIALSAWLRGDWAAI